MSSYFSSTGTRVTADTGEAKGFASSDFKNFAGNDVHLDHAELTNALKTLGRFTDADAQLLAKHLIEKNNGKPPTYDEMMAMLDGNGDGLVQVQETRISLEIIKNGGEIKMPAGGGEGVKDLQAASKLFNPQGDLNQDAVKTALAGLIDSSGKLLTGAAAQDCEDMVLLALLGVGASESEVTTILNVIHNGSDGDRQLILAEIKNMTAAQTVQEERGHITAIAAPRKEKFGDTKSGGSSGDETTTTTTTTPSDKGKTATASDFQSKIKSDSGDGVSIDKLAKQLVDMGVAKADVGKDGNDSPSVALAKRLIESYKDDKGKDCAEPTAKQLTDFINVHDTSSEDINAMELASSIYENGGSFNKSRLTWVLDNSPPEMREKVLKKIIKEQGGVADNEIQGVYDKLVKDRANNQIADLLIGSEDNANADKIKENISQLKGTKTTPSDKGKTATASDFQSKIKSDSGEGVDVNKLAKQLVDMGVAKADSPSVALAERLIASYKASKGEGGAEPTAAELTTFINSHDTSSEDINAMELASSIYENGGSFNKSRLTWVLDNSPPEMREKVLKKIIKEQGGLADNEIQGVYDKLVKDRANNQIANLLIGSEDNANADKIKENISQLKGTQGTGDEKGAKVGAIKRDDFIKKIKTGEDRIDEQKLADVLISLSVTENKEEAVKLAGILMISQGNKTSPSSLYDALNALNEGDDITRSDIMKGMVSRGDKPDDLKYDSGSFGGFWEAASWDTKKLWLEEYLQKNNIKIDDKDKEQLYKADLNTIMTLLFGSDTVQEGTDAEGKKSYTLSDQQRTMNSGDIKGKIEGFFVGKQGLYKDEYKIETATADDIGKSIDHWRLDGKNKQNIRDEFVPKIANRRIQVDEKTLGDKKEAKDLNGKSLGDMASMIVGKMKEAVETGGAGYDDGSAADKVTDVLNIYLSDGQGRGENGIDALTKGLPKEQREAMKQQLSYMVMIKSIELIQEGSFADQKENLSGDRFEVLRGIGYFIKNSDNAKSHNQAFFAAMCSVKDSEKIYADHGDGEDNYKLLKKGDYQGVMGEFWDPKSVWDDGGHDKKWNFLDRSDVHIENKNW